MEEVEEREVSGERRPYRRHRDEKDEKDEKQHEKEEKYTGDPLRGLWWGLVLIVIGGVYFVKQYYHPQLEENWWAYIVLGLGIVFLLVAVVRAVMPEYRGGAWGNLVPGVILTMVGLYYIYGLGIDVWWPVIVIALGVIIIFSAIFRRGRRL